MMRATLSIIVAPLVLVTYWAAAQPTPIPSPLDFHKDLQTKLKLPADGQVMTLTKSGITRVTEVVPYTLFIDEILPDRPTPHQTLIVHFRLHNYSKATISGDVRGDIDGVHLAGAVTTHITNLAPGMPAIGELRTYGRSAGTHTVHIEFADGIMSGTVATGFNTYAPLPHPTPSFLAEDSQEVLIGELDPILTSKDYPPSLTADWPLCGDQTEEFGTSAKVLYEWVSVTPNPSTITAAVGTVVDVRQSTKDFPFSHPFAPAHRPGKDTNLFLVPDPKWASLLADGNKPTAYKCTLGLDEEYCAVFKSAADVPGAGILGVEIDQGLLPADYMPDAKRPDPKRPEAASRDRIAVHGTWIMDCGHNDHHTEIHPPLLVARAHVTADDRLRATFLARPYTVRQVYGPEGAPFLPHALGQVAAATTAPGVNTISVIPSIDAASFSGNVVAQYTLALPPTATSGFLDSAIHYHFEVRPGVSVSVQPTDKYHADVRITFDQATYVAPPLPPCWVTPLMPADIDVLWGKDSGTVMKILGGTESGVAQPLLELANSVLPIPPGTLAIDTTRVAAALSHGVGQLTCTSPTPPRVPTDWVDIARADNSSHPCPECPFPVAGWIVMTWTPNRAVMLSPKAQKAYRFKRAEAVNTPH